MALSVVYQRRALANLRSLHAYIAQYRSRAADEMVARICARISDLTLFPRQGREGPRGGVREMPVPGTPYVVSYRRRGNQIQVLTIRHGARRPLT